jgi:RimJ/RimL family protein N-acetyltransferase
MIKLRDFTAEDVASLARNANNPNVARYLREIFPSPYTLESAEWWVSEGWLLGDSRNTAVDLNGQCIGGAGLQFQQNENRYSCELGYWLGEEYWGQGIATSIVARLKEMAFSEYEIKRLYGPVASGNNASMRVLEKNGFVLEGVLKNNLYLRGNFHDEYVFATYS